MHPSFPEALPDGVSKAKEREKGGDPRNEQKRDKTGTAHETRNDTEKNNL